MKSAQGTITILMSPDFYRYLTPFLTVLGGGGGGLRPALGSGLSKEI